MKKFDAMAFGLACALLWALSTACIYLGARFFGYGLPMVKVMNSLYLGAHATVKGSLIAVIWALIDGFLGGFIFASLYNMFSTEK